MYFPNIHLVYISLENIFLIYLFLYVQLHRITALKPTCCLNKYILILIKSIIKTRKRKRSKCGGTPRRRSEPTSTSPNQEEYFDW